MKHACLKVWHEHEMRCAMLDGHTKRPFHWVQVFGPPSWTVPIIPNQLMWGHMVEATMPRGSAWRS